jgi:hypothetical protein
MTGDHLYFVRPAPYMFLKYKRGGDCLGSMNALALVHEDLRGDKPLAFFFDDDVWPFPLRLEFS